MERRGYLLNDSTGRKEYFVLRKGVLRSYRSDRGELLKQIHLAHSGEVNLLHDGVLEIKAHSPYTWEYTLVASTEEDAEHWYDLFQNCIIESQKSIQNMIELLRNGAQLVKYNYSNYKRTRRLFWISDNGDELRWGKQKSLTDYSKVDLRDCIGIIYGPVTTTFVRCQETGKDAPYCCFSLLFMGRTLDLASYGDMINIWFLGLQYLISRYGTGGQSMPVLSDSQFVVKKGQYKVMERAHQLGVTYMRHLVLSVKEMGGMYAGDSEQFWRHSIRAFGAGGSPYKPPPRSPDARSKLPVPKQLPGVRSADNVKRTKDDDAPMANGNGVATSGGKNTEALELEIQRLQSENERLKATSGDISGDGSTALKFMEERCRDLEGQVINMQQQIKQQQHSSSQDGTTLSNLRKQVEQYQAELATEKGGRRRGETKVTELENQLTALTSEKTSLEATVATLETRLQNEAAAAIESKTSVLERANNEQAQRIEELTVECGQVSKARDDLAAKNEALRKQISGNEEQKSKLRNLFVSLLSKAKDLQILQTELKSAVSVELRQFQDSYFVPLGRGVKSMGNSIANMQDSFKNVQAERRRLHNMVLELKGNIRVFARVRPISDNEKDSEPKDGNKTVQFSEETKVGIYNDYDARKKWFEFDRCFWPGSQQQDVFVEAAPLATSVLDGYNVTIFAYGQTGSGKTYTMRGPKEDPGLYTRVLSELFKLVDEKKGSSRIALRLQITEIYNEQLRDLLSSNTAPSGPTKKVDVKLGQDGSVNLTNVEDYPVKGIQDVFKLMNEADANRAVACTDMNEYSSRSHQILTVKVENESLETGTQYFGKIHLIDLAGSENVGKSGATGQTLKEAQNINKSLSALGDVIQSLQSKSSHVPYRNSKLTMMLKDSLGGDAKMLMIVQCSPAQSNVTETLSTLTFAARARSVELGKAKRNVRASEA
ncbi:unnamed protein product [Amoebophrya sp. A25]|nr:unnamed protein product [Amoebophrya sp. A25]|eukprot:GSA25T00009491001.1